MKNFYRFSLIPGSLLLAFLIQSGFEAKAQSFTVELTPSYYNGYNIECSGDRSGAIELNVTGGQSPFTYVWSNSATTQNLTDLPAGYYRVTVIDYYNETGVAEITLTEPQVLTLDANIFQYPTKYNVSCYNCYNGSITISVYGGVPPYSFTWKDGPTTQNRTSLGEGIYEVTVFDDNACSISSSQLILRAPARDDWTMTGNLGTNPQNHFVGTTDNTDLVFKTNSNESLRLLGNGKIKITNLGTNNAGIVYIDTNGILTTTNVFAAAPPCPSISPKPVPWYSYGNYFQPTQNFCAFLGTVEGFPLDIRTNNLTRMYIDPYGKIGIGCIPPYPGTGSYLLYVEDGIVTREVKVMAGTFPDYVFKTGYQLLSLPELKTFVNTHKHLPGIPSEEDVQKNGGIQLGEMQILLVKKLEEMTLYILEQQGKIDELNQRIKILEKE
jgi:hypothetical protein